jgi:hypothetical protein
MDDSFRGDFIWWGGADPGWIPIAALPKDGQRAFRSSFSH